MPHSVGQVGAHKVAVPPLFTSTDPVAIPPVPPLSYGGGRKVLIARQRLREQGVRGSERTARPSAGPQVNARACNLTVRRRRPKLTPAPITMWPLSAASPPPRVFLHAGCLACAPHVTGGDGWHRNSSLAPSSQFSVTSQKQASEKGGAAESFAAQTTGCPSPPRPRHLPRLPPRPPH